MCAFPFGFYWWFQEKSEAVTILFVVQVVFLYQFIQQYLHVLYSIYSILELFLILLCLSLDVLYMYCILYNYDGKKDKVYFKSCPLWQVRATVPTFQQAGKFEEALFCMVVPNPGLKWTRPKILKPEILFKGGTLDYTYCSYEACTVFVVDHLLVKRY